MRETLSKDIKSTHELKIKSEFRRFDKNKKNYEGEK